MAMSKNDNNKEVLMERFDVFYKAYPRKVSKGQAINTWLKLKPSEELLDKMLEALKWQVKLKNWQNKTYIPHPSTWLNAMKWEDEKDLSLLVGHGNDSGDLTKRQEEELLQIIRDKRLKMRGGMNNNENVK